MPSSAYIPLAGQPTTICPSCCPAPQITSSIPAGVKGGPVLLVAGQVSFQLPLLSGGGLGTGGFSFTLDYLSGYPGTTSIDGTVGINFNYPQNAILIPFGPNVILQTGQNTQEQFTSVGGGIYSSAGNNTAATLTRSGVGTSADLFTLISRDGVVSHFSGLYATIATPGRLLDFKVQQLIESASGNGTIGAGAYGYIYLESDLPANLIEPSNTIVSRTVETDRNGNQVAYDFDVMQMLVHRQVFATRSKNSLQASSWETWMRYNIHNQPLLVVTPQGSSIAYAYEDETNTITINGVPYGRRIGLLKSTTWLPVNSLGGGFPPGNGGSNGQTQLTETYFNDPIFNQQCAGIEVRGNPINSSDGYFTPQNGGTTPTDADKSRYATINFLDYQKDATATVQADAVLQAQLGLTSTQIGQLITFVNNQMIATDGTGGIPAGFAMGIGDVNGEGTGNGTSFHARHQGAVVEIQYPQVRQLIPNTGGGDPWVWNAQTIIELFTSNARGQRTTATDAEGNLTVFVRYPENDPEGAGQYLVPSLSNQQYGFVKEIHRDADPNTVMSLVGSDGDMIAFIGNKITRTNTPGVYQDLVTRYQPSGTTGCTSCAYDPLGNPLSTTDPRGNTTTFDRNELGEAYRTTSPAPYNYQTEITFDANRNQIQVDTLDVVVRFAGNSPADPEYAQFTLSGSGFSADLPTQPGPGGSVRRGWFSNLMVYDLLDNKLEGDVDATGSVPASLVTTYGYDYNQNQITITKPMKNLVEYDYDERDLKIATRIGYSPATGEPGSVTVMAYDGDGNLIDAVGPAEARLGSQSLSVVIADAFRSGTALTHVGDWVTENDYDGFDRLIQATDIAGGTVLNTFDPGGRLIGTVSSGIAVGPTPIDRTGSSNVALSRGNANFDEAARAYEQLQGVFLNTDFSGGAIHTLLSGRTATHAGGGLATNSTTNSNTGTVTLTTGGSSYILSRTVYDGANRTVNTAADNTALTTYAYDGASRQITGLDPLGNQVQTQFDGNGNAVLTTRNETCTISGVTTIESFTSATFYDCLNRPTATAMQGPDGSFTPSLALGSCCSSATLPVSCPGWLTATGTIFSFIGYDSRGNRTNVIDPKANTTIQQYDGASRPLRTLEHLRTGGTGSNAIIDTVTTTNNYDANSNLTRLIDDNGGTTTWSYDTLDRETIMTFHDGSTRLSTYNEASNRTGYTDENGSSFNDEFDPLGRRFLSTITPATNVVGTTLQYFTYDGLSRLTRCHDNTATTVMDGGFTIDSLGRVVEEWQEANIDTRYITHDAFTSLPATDLTYPNTRKVAAGYDALYRRNSATEVTGSSNIAQWAFFGNRIANVTLGNGVVCSFMNNAGTKSAVQTGVPLPAWGDSTTDRLGYDGSGRMIAKRFLPSGSTTALVAFTTQYDPSSNKLFERALHAESRSALYPGYDSMDRLLEYQRGVLASGGGSVTTPITLAGTDSQRAYGLDGLGNWKNTVYTPEGGSPTTEIRQHNKLNEITQFATTPVTYDHGNNAGNSNPLIAQRGNGNIANDGTRIYAYDALNRLTTVKRKSDNAQVAAYTYDALGRRVLKTVTNGGIPTGIANVTYRYLYDGQQIVEELLVGGTTTTLRQFVWGQYIDELIQLNIPTNNTTPPLTAGTYYPLQDLLYRTTATTDTSGAIQEAYDYDAYGNTLMFSAAGTGSNWWADNATTTLQPMCEFLFTGRQYDPETEIYWYRARYFQQRLGRFINRDRISYTTGLFEYAAANPVAYFDPSGNVIALPEKIPEVKGGPIKTEADLAKEEAAGVTIASPSDLIHDADIITDRTFKQLFPKLWRDPEEFYNLFTKPCQSKYGSMAVGTNPVFHFTKYEYDKSALKAPRFEVLAPNVIVSNRQTKKPGNQLQGRFPTNTNILGQRAYLSASGHWTWECICVCDPFAECGGEMTGETIEVKTHHAFASRVDINRAIKKLDDMRKTSWGNGFEITSYGDELTSSGNVGGFGYVDESNQAP